MQFRRAANTEKPLSLIAVKVKVSEELSDPKEKTAVLGEAVKGLMRNLRSTDTVYSLAHGLFGVVMPETTLANANLIELQIEQTLRSVGGGGPFGIEITVCKLSGTGASAHELEDVIASLMPEKQFWEEVGTAI